ncbi:glycosyltransferase family 2 protein [Dysgonomonas macrotermitis]|uniref:Glycosyltransferase involved in cell wall bisynthesis n=1 Tax=Dysgonomonas macrotermitis TaxID=1346286 RepID=A0A1M5DTA6_9BACT|nr:glycosyltransferase [Dysgonomonas macrotermitis]SHF70156.1 Glycosyltransferase involved in cell wall bisynthesis [Dysgonomonas macrotermitis]
MVSVIIPNYNHAPYLKLRIDSVLNQTYQDFEVILLDDKSTDNSREIIKEYTGHPKVSHIIFNETNSGTTFKQWQKGLELSKGEYVWIAESDDHADETFLEKVMASIGKYQSVLGCALSQIINENGHIKRSRAAIMDEEYCKKEEFLSKHLLLGNVIYNASTVVFRKDAIQASIWDEITKLKYCGDWLFWARLIMTGSGGVTEVKEYLNYFRTHSGNVSNKSETNGLTFLEGFPISKMIAKEQNIKCDKQFRQKWFFEWQHYRAFYHFSKKTSLKVFLLFLKREPLIALYELERLVTRFFKR